MSNPDPMPPPSLDSVGVLQVLQARDALRRAAAAPPGHPDATYALSAALDSLDGALADADADTRPGVHRDGDDGLVARLCRAVGVDPATSHGFRLSVIPNEWPMLEVIPLLPAVPGGVAQSFAERIEAVGRQFLLMPADAPMAELAVARDDAYDMVQGLVSLDGAGIDIDEALDFMAGQPVTVLVPKPEPVVSSAMVGEPPAPAEVAPE